MSLSFGKKEPKDMLAKARRDLRRLEDAESAKDSDAMSDALMDVSVSLGSVVAVIGTIGYYAFGRIVDRQKNQRIEQLESGNTALKKQLQETAQLAEPTKLEFALTKPFAVGQGVGALVYFKASKKEALGR